MNQSIYDCSFDTDYCQWLNDSTSDIMWVRRTGASWSVNTGIYI